MVVLLLLLLLLVGGWSEPSAIQVKKNRRQKKKRKNQNHTKQIVAQGSKIKVDLERRASQRDCGIQSVRDHNMIRVRRELSLYFTHLRSESTKAGMCLCL